MRPVAAASPSPSPPPALPLWAGERTSVLREHLRGFLLAAVVGVLGGLTAIGFQKLTDLARIALFAPFGVKATALLVAAEALSPWQRLLVPTCGAALAALLLYGVFRRRGAFGMADIMGAVSLRRGEVRLDEVLTRSVATCAVIGSGGSTGREGPIIQLGSALASSIGRLVRLRPRELSVLIACGAAAGMAGAYNAPIGAAMFVMEVILGSFVMEQFAPVIVASVTSTFTVRAVVGVAAVYDVPPLTVGSPWEAIPIFVLGVLSALAGWGFLRAITFCEDRMRASRLPRTALAVVGGLLVGALGILFPEVWGNGFDAVSERILVLKVPLATLGILIVVKTLATGITSGSGISGGVFTPTLFIGAALGAAFGTVTKAVFPTVDPALFALIGMGSVLAATTHAPLMSILILFEMTHDPPLIAPLMLGAVTATLFARWIHADSHYTASLKRRGIRLPEGAEEAALLRTHVRDLLREDAIVFAASAPLSKVVDAFLSSRRDAVYVTGADGAYQGVARIHDVKAVFGSSPDVGTIIAMDVAVPIPSVGADEAIAAVLPRFEDGELDELPVVAGGGDRRLVGVLSRRDILAMLRHEVLVERSRPVRVAKAGGGASTYLELPPGWRLAEVPAPATDWGRPLDVAAWRAARGATPLLVLRSDGVGGRTPLPPGPEPLREGDAVLVLGPERPPEAPTPPS